MFSQLASRLAFCSNRRLISSTFTASAAVVAGALYLNTEKTLELKSAPIDSRSVNAHVKRGDIAGLKSMAKSSEELKAIVNKKHPLGWSPIHLAVTAGDYAMVKFLLENGADPNEEDRKPAKIDRIEYMTGRAAEFSRSIVPSADCSGFTALHYGVVVGNERIVRLLLEYDADPGSKSKQGHVPKDYFDEDEQPHSLLSLLEDAEKTYAEKKARLEKELRRKFPLEQRLKEVLVGQRDPIESVASAIRRKENGWSDDERPLVFLLLGSSGVGKTKLAKEVANYIHKEDKDRFIKIDMSEFQSKHEVAKFIGSPPGYVGYEEGGQLTEKLKRVPNAVVLLDEVEKAHIDVLTIMLQVFDEGRLTDGKGNTVECKDAIFIMTSNLAQQEIAAEAELLREDKKIHGSKQVDDERRLSKKFIDGTIHPILRRHFQRDEFLGRIDEILFFLPFTNEELSQLALQELNKWQKRAEARHQIKLTWSPDIVDKLILGYNVQYGARSIIHEVERRIVKVNKTMRTKINAIEAKHLLRELEEEDAYFDQLDDDEELEEHEGHQSKRQKTED